MSGTRSAGAAIALYLCLSGCAACGRPDLVDVPLPDLSRSDSPVQSQIRDAYAAVQKAAELSSADAMGYAYGDLGMLLHAAEYWSAAEAAYVNAQTLLPDDPRWPYYLGHVFRRAGAPEKSLAAFSRALELQPSDVPTFVWLSRTYTDQGRAADALTMLERARDRPARACHRLRTGPGRPCPRRFRQRHPPARRGAVDRASGRQHSCAARVCLPGHR